jgi:hypothetical protein
VGPSGQNTLIVGEQRKILEEVEIIGNMFLSGSYNLEFFNTTFDLIAISVGIFDGNRW